MIGATRLVNPWRGTVYGGFVGALAVTTADGVRFEVHQDDHYPGRSFARDEIEAWAARSPLSPAELSVAHGVPERDGLGAVPARSGDPAEWTWYQITGGGESRLRRDARPSAAELAEACRDAIAACEAEAVPLLDRYELWGCDLDTGEPIALLLTGLTEHEARGTFSPLWRHRLAADLDDAGRELQREVNARIAPITGGRCRFACRLFERLDGVNRPRCREIDLGRGAVAEIDVPVGLLAEPFETRRQSLA